MYERPFITENAAYPIVVTPSPIVSEPPDVLAELVYWNALLAIVQFTVELTETVIAAIQ